MAKRSSQPKRAAQIGLWSRRKPRRAQASSPAMMTAAAAPLPRRSQHAAASSPLKTVVKPLRRSLCICNRTTASAKAFGDPIPAKPRGISSRRACSSKAFAIPEARVAARPYDSTRASEGRSSKGCAQMHGGDVSQNAENSLSMPDPASAAALGGAWTKRKAATIREIGSPVNHTRESIIRTLTGITLLAIVSDGRLLYPQKRS